MSPEGMSHALSKYVESLQHQVETAEAFFYGRIAEGIEGLLTLPEPTRLRIDQLIWQAAGGEAIDPTDEASGELISDAILFSLEERMGMHE
ncbi:MAG: hypothetical protein FJZ64_03840 [Chlamydiae bacterium]|nr:hypothetical protein [Chlamydiota bacterium]